MNHSARSNVLPLNQGQEGTARRVQQKPDRPRRTLRFKGRHLVLVVAFTWFAYMFFFVQAPKAERVEQDQARLEAELKQTEQINADLAKKIEQLQDPDYIAEVARKKYMMIKEGETLFMESKQ